MAPAEDGQQTRSVAARARCSPRPSPKFDEISCACSAADEGEPEPDRERDADRAAPARTWNCDHEGWSFLWLDAAQQARHFLFEHIHIRPPLFPAWLELILGLRAGVGGA